MEPSPDWKAFYFLDALGGLHSIGKTPPMPKPETLPYYSDPGEIVDFEIIPEGKIFILLSNGRIHSTNLQ